MNYLFGFPVGVYKIDSNDYDKEKIVSDIIYNYNIDVNRNKWDDFSNLHHQYGDNDNDKFIKINYSKLFPLYDEKVRKYLNNFKFKKDFHYKFKIVNYTCAGKGQYMKKHIHPGCAFSGVHYIKFNEKEHMGTTFHNRHPHIEFIPELNNKFGKIKNVNDIAQSWTMKDWTFDVEEDCICFSPSALMHSVSQPKGNDLRITIAINIDIVEE